MHVKTGDKVKVIAGRDKGKEGTIIKAIPKEDRVVVEKVNLVKRHQKPTQEFPDGGIITKEAPIAVSNVMVVCKSCKSATRIGHTFLENGKKTRVCKKCGKPLE